MKNRLFLFNIKKQFGSHSGMPKPVYTMPGYYPEPLPNPHRDHHHEEYDWRFDPEVNTDLATNIRNKGYDHTKYKFPYEGVSDWKFPSLPENWDPSNLKLDLQPQNIKNDGLYNSMPAAYWNPEADLPHEFDYESEDRDFQPESFYMQVIKLISILGRKDLCGLI